MPRAGWATAEGRLSCCFVTTRKKAEALARELLAEKRKTEKELCEQIYNEAVEIIESRGLKYNGIIVAEKDDWHFGVIGIVASRICEKYSKPCILFKRQRRLVSRLRQEH